MYFVQSNLHFVLIVSDIAVFVLKRDVKLQPTNFVLVVAITDHRNKSNEMKTN